MTKATCLKYSALAYFVALVLSAAFTLVLIPVLRKLGLLDQPSEMAYRVRATSTRS